MRKITIPGVEGEIDFELKMSQIIAVEREVGPLYEKNTPIGEVPSPRLNEMKVLRALAWHGCKSGIKSSDLDNLSMVEFVTTFSLPVVGELAGGAAMEKAKAMMLDNAAKSEAPKDAGGE